MRRGFGNGCSKVNMVRYHGDGKRRLKLLFAALDKMIIPLILLVFSRF